MSYQVDKEASLEIVREIVAKLTTPGSICLNREMQLEDFYSMNYAKENTANVVEFRHKLAVVELATDEQNGDKIEDHYEQILSGEYQNKFYDDRSTSIEIHEGSCIQDSQIALVAYLHGTSAESDISYPTFSYDNVLKMWVIKSDFWGAEHGLDCNGIVTILDFSEYFE